MMHAENITGIECVPVDVFSLAFNRNCTRDSLLQNSYFKRHFQLTEMIPLEYPHLEDHLEELLLIHTRYREKKRAAQARTTMASNPQATSQRRDTRSTNARSLRQRVLQGSW